MPQFKQYQIILWALFALSFPLRMYTTWFAFGACLCGLIKRCGFPKFSQEYMQRAIFDDNFHMITYLGPLTMGGGSFILYIPLVLTAFMETAPTAKAFLDRNPNLPLVSSLKDTFNQGVQHKGQFLEMRSDIEVYIGLYLIVVWFLGWSSFIEIILYWQLMRMRYMMSYNI